MLLSNGVVGLFPFEKSDAELYRSWINDEEVIRWVGRALPVPSVQHHAWYETLATDPHSVVFAVRKLAGDVYLGNVWLHDVHWVHRRAELRIVLGRDSGQGYGSAACQLACRYAYNKLNLHKIYLYVATANYRAVRAFAKAGFLEEARLKDEFFIDGAYHDALRMAAFS